MILPMWTMCPKISFMQASQLVNLMDDSLSASQPNKVFPVLNLQHLFGSTNWTHHKFLWINTAHGDTEGTERRS